METTSSNNFGFRYLTDWWYEWGMVTFTVEFMGDALILLPRLQQGHIRFGKGYKNV